jgi:hypothetical protein
MAQGQLRTQLKKWEEEIIPHEWKCGKIYPVHEKGDVIMCDYCRTDTLLCTTNKILENILYVKLLPYSEKITGEYQGCFQRGRSTVTRRQTYIGKMLGTEYTYSCT